MSLMMRDYTFFSMTVKGKITTWGVDDLGVRTPRTSEFTNTHNIVAPSYEHALTELERMYHHMDTLKEHREADEATIPNNPAKDDFWEHTEYTEEKIDAVIITFTT